MQHYGFLNADLTANNAAQFRRVLPLGQVDTDTDDQAELVERLGVDADLRSAMSKLIKAAQTNTSGDRSVNGFSRSDDAGVMTLLVLVAESGVQTELHYGTLVPDRDSGDEWMRRAGDLSAFISQLSELLALATAHPALEIGTSLVFISDKGASI